MSEVSGRGGATVRPWAEFARYFAVSGGGFIVDFCVLAFLVEIVGMALIAANTISFTSGMIAVYLGSIFWVFETRRLEDARREFLIFCGIGVAVLTVNHIALLMVVEGFGAPYYIAKVIAAGASFIANFLIRRAALFS